jgi:hypothetical protein
MLSSLSAAVARPAFAAASSAVARAAVARPSASLFLASSRAYNSLHHGPRDAKTGLPLGTEQQQEAAALFAKEHEHYGKHGHLVKRQAGQCGQEETESEERAVAFEGGHQTGVHQPCDAPNPGREKKAAIAPFQHRRFSRFVAFCSHCRRYIWMFAVAPFEQLPRSPRRGTNTA